MTVEQIAALVGSLGFPIVISWYLLTTFKRSLDANTASNQAIKEVLAHICDKLNISTKP